MYPHRINLREPWQKQPGTKLNYARAFNWPTKLMPFEELWLVVGTVFSPFRVTLNQQLLGEQPFVRVPLELPVTPYLQSQNLLQIECLEQPSYEGVRNVFLEVRAKVHLQHLIGSIRWENDRPRLHLNAKLNGQPDRPLSIVVRLNHHEVHYQEVGLPGKVIEVSTPALDVQPWQIGQHNELYDLEVQLLDPACSLSQHHYLTGFAPPENGTAFDTMPDHESYLESSWLDQADRTGKLVAIKDYDQVLPYVWHHPSVRRPSALVAASPREDLRCF